MDGTADGKATEAQRWKATRSDRLGQEITETTCDLGIPISPFTPFEGELVPSKGRVRMLMFLFAFYLEQESR
jgi:hypothetical protein